MTDYTMRRRALHQAEPIGERRVLSRVWLWLSVAMLVASGLVSLLVILAFLWGFLWGVFQAGLLLLRLLGLR